MKRSPAAAAAGLAALGLVAAFTLAPARELGRFPAPLDDVYIHFDFARALAHGEWAWIAGQGYSSGETAPLYALALAALHRLGLGDAHLGLGAAAVAVVGTAAAIAALGRLVAARPGAGRAAPWLAPLVLFACPLADAALASGMETALFAPLALLALVHTGRATGTPADRRGRTRAHAQWWVGALVAALVLVRPESALFALVLAATAARGAGGSSALAAAARVAGPALATTAAVAATNLALTGDPASAGARLKLLSSNPWLADADRGRAWAEALVTFVVRVFGRGFGDHAAAALVPLGLAGVALAARRTRPVALAAVLGAAGWAALVSWNSAAPFQNLRYYAPAVLLGLVASSLGLGGLLARPRLRALGALALLALVAFGRAPFARERDLFARSARNVAHQQVEVGRRLAALARAEGTPDAVVLVGDAGAIPWESRLHAVDALGLGGTARLPFAAAATLGEGAMVELLERLPLAQRPSLFALYPAWFPEVTRTLGTPFDAVHIDDNVVCGGPTKVLYRADLSPLLAPDGNDAPAGTWEALDVADVVDERAHDVHTPAPRGGWVHLAVHALAGGPRRFDATRELPAGTELSFVLRAAPPPGAAGTLVVRVRPTAREAEPPVLALQVGDGSALPLVLRTAATDAWWEARGALPELPARARLRLRAERGPVELAHVWFVGEARPAPGADLR